VVTCGTSAAQDILRSALAMGADRAILVQVDVDQLETLQPLAVAKLLKAVVDEEQPSLIICGKQAIDDDANQTGQMLAALKGWPQATFASKILVSGNKATVTREVDGGLETIVINMPALISTDLRLNNPRFTTLPNIMKAKSKPLNILVAADMGVDMAPRLNILSVSEPAKRTAGIRVGDVAQLIEKLKNEAKVI
jgi:electron transfer flavoprotein beta subunit